MKKEVKKEVKKKSPAKKASAKKSSKDTAAKPVKSEAKYEKVGQRKATPEPLNAYRLFYSSMFEQKPDSELAEKWCMVHGLLDDDGIVLLFPPLPLSPL